MTATIDRPDEAVNAAPKEEEELRLDALRGDSGESATGGPTPPEEVVVEEAEPVAIRPLLVAALSSSGAALMTGGIFGSWGARLLGMAAALFGVAWCWLTLRSVGRRLVFQFALPVVLLVFSIVSVTLGAKGGASNLPHLIDAAVKSGRLLRPPIPFDAGWRPLLIVFLALVGYGAAWVGTALEKPQQALVLPLPLLALTAITQPKDQQLLAGLLGVIPLVAAIAVVFGGDSRSASKLSTQFELRRAVRGAALMVPAIGFLLLLNSTSILFPKPVYDPEARAQKPKAVPLSQADDRVLFEIKGEITGPWQMGVLDVYDGTTWRLPPYQPKKLRKVGADGVVDTRTGDVDVSFTVRDLGTSGTLPGVVGPTKISATTQRLLFDPRSGTFRMPSGRVPNGLSYTMTLAKYPQADQLRNAPPVSKRAKLDKDLTAIPAPPPAVKSLLAQAPTNKWDRVDFLLKKLNEVEIAVGSGTPVAVPPSKVQKILAGNHEGSPYELVATQAMLARWAGVPSRIGFGFDGEQQEGDVLTVRPKNAAQWLEVYFEGYGWVPIITSPPKAKASLDNDKNSKFNATIQPSTDVAVEVYIPVKVQSLRAFYQKVRDVLLRLVPLVLLGILVYLGLPWVERTWRRMRRRRWAAARGPAEQVLIEYVEFRDLATDLGVGDPYATPIEFVDHIAEDEEHEELAWLVTRVLYGDMIAGSGEGEATREDALAARELADSLRQRLAKAQPAQTRFLAIITRSSLREPYTLEVPSVPSLVRAERVRA